ncbi:MAG: VOC family protein [Alphaproteobacteria bacterium]
MARKTVDKRPPVAIGHVRIEVGDVTEATDAFARLGLRRIFDGDNFAVMELRGGTHLVVRQAEGEVAPGTPAPFDLMVDDIDAAKADYKAAGFKTTTTKRGSIHDSFAIEFPSGHRLTINSSHAGDRPV